MATQVPLPAPPSSPGMSRGTKVLLWSVGGCAVVAVVVVIALVALGAAVFSRNFNLRLSGVTAPADFPVYPGARQTAAFGVSGKSGSTVSASLVQWQVPGGAQPVRAWYRSRLNEGDWELLDEPLTGTFVFRRRSTGSVARVQVRDEVLQTLVQLQLTDDQPLEPGAHPAAGVPPAPGASP